MGRAEKEHLTTTLNSHLNTIHETFQVLDQAPPSTLEKVNWTDVIQMSDEVAKQATMAGMLWTGEAPEVKMLEENMAAYFNMLQGFLLFAHGSTVGAGRTLSSNIHAAGKQVVDCSFMLWRESVSSYGSGINDKKLSIPQLVGAVWDACSAIKKTPATNITAIGRAMTQVAVSVKDVLREMKELKQADPTDEVSDEVSSTKDENGLSDNDSSSDGDLGNDLSPEEMKIAQFAISVVSEILLVIKELIRSITGLIKKDNSDNNSNLVDSLERLLKLCQEIGLQVDELGACLYPPQEVPAIKAASEKISTNIDEMQVEIESLKGSSEAFFQACNSLRSSLQQLESEFGYSDTADLVPKIQNLALSN